MVVGVLILYAGLGMLKESVEGILHPSDMNVSILTVLIVAGTAVTKFYSGNVYNKSRKIRRIRSITGSGGRRKK